MLDISVSSLSTLLRPSGLYLVAYAWLFGMCTCLHSVSTVQVADIDPALWVTFFGGMRATAMLRQNG